MEPFPAAQASAVDGHAARFSNGFMVDPDWRSSGCVRHGPACAASTECTSRNQRLGWKLAQGGGPCATRALSLLARLTQIEDIGDIFENDAFAQFRDSRFAFMRLPVIAGEQPEKGESAVARYIA